LTWGGFDWGTFLVLGKKIGLAYLLALPIGWDREREGHAAGIRTFPLVAVASCGYLLAIADPADKASVSRVLQGLVAGIGFVGGGAIVRDGANVRGTATAASIWMTGAIGAAAALDRWELAWLLSLLSLFTLKALLPIKKRLESDQKG
jgi:putative Mg2+ transporter-C (MgtC) family protein